MKTNIIHIININISYLIYGKNNNNQYVVMDIDYIDFMDFVSAAPRKFLVTFSSQEAVK